MWADCVVSRDACLPCNQPPTNNSGGECDILEPFPFQQFLAVFWIGYGGLQAGPPSCPAKPSEHIRGDDRHKMLDWSSCADIPRGNVVNPLFIWFSSKANQGLVSQTRCHKLSQDHKSGCMLLALNVELYY